jgi:hypothetical protein
LAESNERTRGSKTTVILSRAAEQRPYEQRSAIATAARFGMKRQIAIVDNVPSRLTLVSAPCADEHGAGDENDLGHVKDHRGKELSLPEPTTPATLQHGQGERLHYGLKRSRTLPAHRRCGDGRRRDSAKLFSVRRRFQLRSRIARRKLAFLN